MSFPDQILDGIFFVLELLFKTRFVAPLILLPLLLGSAGLLWWRAAARATPFLKAARTRVAEVRKALGTDSDPSAERTSFANAIGEVSGAMAAGGVGAAPLVRAWHEFHESIVDETETPIRNTTRPTAFFLRAIPRQKDLIFWSNTFVGIGLILTFLGIVVALNATAHGMRDGASIQESQGALRDLLTIASVKFFSSIAGLGASLMLRFAEHGLTKKCEYEVHEICDLLERGLLYVPPQVLAVRQLDELKRQSTQLEKFNTDLALSIGEQVGQQFQAAMAPMQGSLGALNTSMEQMSDRLSERLGEGVGKAIESATNGELRALGHTLEALRSRLEGLSGHVEGSGEHAAQQIRAAGADFAQAANDIREAFSGLTGQVSDMGRSIKDDSEAARSRQAELLAGTIAQFDAVNAKSSEAMTQAAEALKGAGIQVANDLQGQMSSAMTAASKEAEGVVRDAIASSGAAFAESGKSIIDAVEAAAKNIAAVAAAIERSERGASGTADAFQKSADGARATATAINDAASSFATAATPVAATAAAFRDAAAKISSSVERSEEATAAALGSMRNLAEGIGQTQEAAHEAWTSYRARFEGVDQSLEKTLGQMVSTLSETMAEFQRFAHEVDLEMSRAVGRLAQSMTTIEESTESIAQLAEALRERDAASEAAE